MPLSAPVRCMVLGGVTAAAVIAALGLDPIPQPASYHAFADARPFLGIPRFADVASNLPFLLVGIAGLRALRRACPRDAAERRAYEVFFAAVAAVAFGSAWYHLAPTTQSLFWDRLPMAVAFGGLSAALVAERIHPAAGRLALWPLVAASVATVVWWRISEDRGRGDLRPYLLAQALPAIWLVVLVALFPSRTGGGREFAWLVAWYAAATALELLDAEVFRVTAGVVSGHTLKHLAAAAATWQVVRLVRARSPSG